VALALPSIALSPLCWHDGGGSKWQEKKQDLHVSAICGVGSFFCLLRFFCFAEVPIAVCGGGQVRDKSTSFFGLGVCMQAFADLVADLASKAAFFLHRTGFSCADLNPEL
jgi:hypothetical protein